MGVFLIKHVLTGFVCVATQMSEASEGFEGMAGLRGTAENHRRFQRDRSPAGDDVEQGDAESTLGQNRSVN